MCTKLQGYRVILWVINKIIHCITCKHAPPEKPVLNALVQPAADEGCVYAPREDGPDAGEDAAPVLCRRQHAKALPGCHQEERWAVSGPQREITCTKAFSHHAMESAHHEKMPVGLPKPPTHAPLALRRSGPVLMTPSHPCTAQQIVTAANELALSCRSSHSNGSVKDALRGPQNLYSQGKEGRWTAKSARSG